ncbi:hypothetical protein NC652_014134 [Populus alba x Populus x berolinensis]|nr:hypothetical protein NC652_014134 [Populus alba x Populus x berolinensis]
MNTQNKRDRICPCFAWPHHKILCLFLVVSARYVLQNLPCITVCVAYIQGPVNLGSIYTALLSSVRQKNILTACCFISISKVNHFIENLGRGANSATSLGIKIKTGKKI